MEQEQSKPQGKVERIGHTKALVISARHVHHFVVLCATVEEARRSLPDLTEKQFQDIRAGRARLIGDTESGLSLVANVGLDLIEGA